jgi:hypothetical protein
MESRLASLILGVIVAGLAAAILFFLIHDAFGVSNNKIVIDSLGLAGLLCIMFSLGEMNARRPI